MTRDRMIQLEHPTETGDIAGRWECGGCQTSVEWSLQKSALDSEDGPAVRNAVRWQITAEIDRHVEGHAREHARLALEGALN